MIPNKFMPLSLLLIFSLILIPAAYSQTAQHTISGKVIDDDMGVPLEYATVSITKPDDPGFMDGGVTDMEGNFAITVPAGTYNIAVEYISFETKHFRNRQINADLNLGTIELGISSASLDEVVVIAETTEVEVRLDKKIYNIGKDLTTAGGTVGDALNNVPSVTVDVDGGISLRGNENVRILINGRPSAMAGFGSTDVLAQLPAEAIERVEVITSPSARYDAQGTAGILNIILRKDKTLGFNGSVTTNVGYPESYGVNANVNFRTNNFNFFNTTGYNYRNRPGNGFNDTRYLAGDFDRVIEDRDIQRLNRRLNTNFGIEYYINDQSSITMTNFFRIGNDSDISITESDRYRGGTLTQQTIRTERERDRDRSYQFALNYINRFNDVGHTLTADVQYGFDKGREPAMIREIPVLDLTDDFNFFPSERVYSEGVQNEFLAQVDYVLPLGEDSQFEAGYRGNFEENMTDYNLDIEDEETGMFLVSPLTNIFTYTENVNALYTQYGSRFGDFSFLLGLRLENTQLKGVIESPMTDTELREEFGFDIDTNFDNNYLGLFPTVNLIYELNDRENITLGYNRRINRPRSWFINPFPSRASRTNVFQGNPNLNPAFASAFDLGYLKRWDKLTLTTSVYYQYETDSFERIQQGTGEEFNGVEIIRTIPINLSTNQRTGAELGLLYNPARWLRLNGSFNYFQFETEGEFGGRDYGAKNTSWFARGSAKVTLPGNIDWQTNAFYRGPQENAITQTDGIFSIDIALAKDILNDNATISFNVRDVFNTRRRVQFTETERFLQDSEFQWRVRSFTASLVYRFNQQKRDQQRRGRNGGGDEDGEFEG